MEQKMSKMPKSIQEFWAYKDLLKLLVSRNIKLKYRRSFLGYVWSVLNPLLIMIVMTIVFSTMFDRNIENFPVYLFCGQLLFNFMNTSTHQAIFAITGNAALLKKTYVPKYIFVLSKLTGWALLFPLVFLQLYIFCVGLGLFLAQANVFFRDSQFIYNAVTTAWMYLTPIFYPIEMLPDWVAWFVKHLNPMYFYVGQFRDLVYYGRLPGPSILAAGCLTAVGMLVIGLWSFRRSEDKFILYI